MSTDTKGNDMTDIVLLPIIVGAIAAFIWICVRRACRDNRNRATADGRRYERGPYPVYSFKERGRTVSRRLHSGTEVDLYRQQIHNGRRFQQVVGELLRLGEQLSDATVHSGAVKKTPPTRSRRTRKSASG